MKVLFLNAYFYPETIAFSHLEKDLIQDLVAEGARLDVLCPIPCRGVSPAIAQTYRLKREERLYNGKVRVHRFWAPWEKKNPIIRAFRYFWCNLRQYQLGKKYQPDVIFAVSVPQLVRAVQEGL